jgi:hypothetical protein
MKMIAFRDVAPCSLVEVVRSASIIRGFFTLIMEAVSTSGISAYSNETTRRCIPEDSNIHTRRGENLKPQKKSRSFVNSYVIFTAKN